MLNSDKKHINNFIFIEIIWISYRVHLSAWILGLFKHVWYKTLLKSIIFHAAENMYFFQINLFKNLKNNDSKFQHLKIYFSCHRFLSITQLNETEKKHHPSIINFSCFYKYSFSSSLFSQLSSHRYQLVTAPILTVMIGVLL